jgi:hypothetical protein
LDFLPAAKDKLEEKTMKSQQESGSTAKQLVEKGCQAICALNPGGLMKIEPQTAMAVFREFPAIGRGL